MATKTVFVFVLLCLCYFQIVTGVSEREVTDMLLKDYQKEGRPVRDPTQAVETSLDVFLIQIVKLITQRQVLVINFWLVHRWKDDFLTWNPAEYGNISSIRIGSENIWRPRLVNYNREHEEGWSETPDTNAIVRSDGEVLWNYPITIHSTCVMDIARFPFDVQKCPLKIGSWTYDSSKLKIVNRSETGDTNQFIENAEWKLLSFDLEVNHVEYSCCPGVLWDDMTYTIVIQRRSTFFVLYTVMPCAILAFMAVCGFWLPPDSGERMFICINAFLSMIVLEQVANKHLPDTATTIPLINIFMGVSILLVFASSALTILTLSLLFKTFDLQPVPKWLRRIFCLGSPDPNIIRLAPKVSPKKVDANVLEVTELEDLDASFATDRAKATSQLVRRARKVLLQLKKEYEMMSRYEKIQKEWKIVAGKIDRCILIAFFIALVVISGAIFGPSG
ncbi:acetylcholine receptor subunit alpha-like [Branchiostoma lanceolatum]|uniref:acetylcholine receptor subunit alpha-like n=1 Tax=Branchiostoma lanceolatum TaxID=7740 RepID=UPI0034524AE5